MARPELSCLPCFQSRQDFLEPPADQGLKVSDFPNYIFFIFTSHFCAGREGLARGKPLSGQSLDQQWHLVASGEGWRLGSRISAEP